MKIKVTLVLLFGLYGVHDCARTCEKVDQCTCKYADTGKDISLWEINRADGHVQKPFHDIADANSMGFTYDYNPCTPFTIANMKPGCTDQLVCQKYSAGSIIQFFSAANAQTLRVDSGDKNVVFKYIGPVQAGVTRGVEITLVCDKTAEAPTMSRPQQENKDKTATYKFTITTRCACEGVCSTKHPANHHDHGLSTGSILCIVLLVLVVVYLIGGILFMKFYKKEEGGNLIPNREFWSDLPSKIKDGFKFSYAKVTRKSDEYEQI